MRKAPLLGLILSLVVSTTPIAAQGWPNLSDWSRVRAVKPGAQVFVIVGESKGGTRYLISASDTNVLVLNLTDRRLPPVVTRALRKLVAAHPEYLEDGRAGTVWALDSDVFLRHDGVFVGAQKIVDRDVVIERLARLQITEMRWPTPRSAHPIKNRVLIGTGIGLLAGMICGRAADCKNCDDPGLTTLLGSAFGAGSGAIVGLLSGLGEAAKPTGIIYRA
jgi:hypothetical protein